LDKKRSNKLSQKGLINLKVDLLRLMQRPKCSTWKSGLNLT